MRILVKEFRAMVEQSFLNEKQGDAQKSEFYEFIGYNPDGGPVEGRFYDRYHNTLPSVPSSMDPRAIRTWMSQNGVESIEVRGKKLSPQNFMRFIELMGGQRSQDTRGQIPIVKGTPIQDPPVRKLPSGIPIVRGEPA